MRKGTAPSCPFAAARAVCKHCRSPAAHSLCSRVLCPAARLTRSRAKAAAPGVRDAEYFYGLLSCVRPAWCAQRCVRAQRGAPGWADTRWTFERPHDRLIFSMTLAASNASGFEEGLVDLLPTQLLTSLTSLAQPIHPSAATM